MANRPSFAERRKLSLKDFREQALESQSQLSSMTLVADNNEEFEIPHPMMISDEAQRRLELVQSGEDLDKDKDGKPVFPARIKGKFPEPLSARFARALLGDEEHKRFIAAGGHSHDVELAWEMLVKEHKETEEKDPK
jgi:hypothetical protein